MLCLIFSDIHGNLPAFEQVIKKETGIDQYINIGDVVNYGPWSNECVELIESLNCINIKGNHEEYFINGECNVKNVETFKTIYSNKTFDYMSCKKPILLVIDGVSRELVEKAKCRIFAEPENPLSIANKSKEMSTLEKSDLNQMGLNGYNYARENFDRVKLSKKYIQEINTIVNDK